MRFIKALHRLLRSQSFTGDEDVTAVMITPEALQLHIEKCGQLVGIF